MTDTEYKARNLKPIQQPSRPTTFWARGGGAVRQDKTAALWQAQDSALVGRRIVAQFGPGSPALRIPANVTPFSPIGVQSYPTQTESFEVCGTQGRLIPGCWLEMRALVMNSGPTQSGGLPTGTGGSLECEAVFTNLVTVDVETSTRSAVPPPSQIEFSGLPTGAGSYFDSLRPMWVGPLRPEPPEDLEAAATYGENTLRGVTVNAIGSVRMVSACVSQVPWTYATLNSSSDETAHASNFAQAPDAQPKTETPDGTTYADNRFGTARTLAAAENQPRRLGPVLMTWTAYDASAWSPGDASSPLSVTLAATGSYQRVNALDTSQTSYDASSAGWPLMTHLAMNYATSGPECMREQAAAVPCTLYVRYTATLGGPDCFVCVRTERSCVRVPLATNASPTWVSATGHIEGSISTEDAFGTVAQIWIEGDDCTVGLLSVALEFGHLKT